MTPSEYPEKRFRHSQRDPAWANIKIGKSGLLMKDFGCVISSCAYIISRWNGVDTTPGQLVKWLNVNGGFTSGGLLYWNKIDKYCNNKLVYTTNQFNRTYTLRNVLFSRYSHWVVELRGGLSFDPWDGKIKEFNKEQMSGRWRDTGKRRYFKANTKEGFSPVT